jgi:hypothetical protein
MGIVVDLFAASTPESAEQYLYAFEQYLYAFKSAPRRAGPSGPGRALAMGREVHQGESVNGPRVPRRSWQGSRAVSPLMGRQLGPLPRRGGAPVRAAAAAPFPRTHRPAVLAITRPW